MSKAMILAAGLGTRLRPLTESKPKALVEVGGIPLLEYVIRHLKINGFREIIVNIHHKGDQIEEFLWKKNNFGIRIEISDERKQLLDTGGGIRKASWFFDKNEPFLVYNVDVLTDMNLRNFYNDHLKSGALISLAVRNRKTSRYFLFDQAGFLCGWKNMATNEIRITTPRVSRLSPRAFSGIQVLNPEVIQLLEQYPDVFSVTDAYIQLSMGYKIRSYMHDKSFWMDLGKKEDLERANEILSKYNFLLSFD